MIMKQFIVFLLLLSGLVHGQVDQGPEWQFYVPSEGIEIDAELANGQNMVLVNQLDGDISHVIVPLQDWVNFTLPPQSTITSLTFTQRPFTQVVFTLSQAADPFQYGDIIRCDIDAAPSCNLLLNVHDSLGIPKDIGVDAMSWLTDSPLNASKFAISFDRDFTYDNQPVLHQNIYIIALDFASIFDDLQTSPFVDISNIGLTAPTGINGYDITSHSAGTWVSLVSDRVITTTSQHTAWPSEIFDYFDQNNPHAIADEIKAKAQSLSAFSATNSGWAEFRFTSTSGVENQGTLDLPVDRPDGDEQYMGYQVQVTGGTATEGADFNLVTTGLAWVNEDAASKNVRIELIDNNSLGGEKTIELKLVPDSFFALVNPSNQDISVSITDDEPFDLIFKDGFE